MSVLACWRWCRRSLVAVALCAVVGNCVVGPVSARSFRSCAEVKRSYPNGVAINFAASGKSRAEINRDVYLKNQKLDRDRDGIICEDELRQNPPTSTIPMTCAQGGRCGVGDIGPAGGIIFYVSSVNQSWGNALEAAPLSVGWSSSSGQDPLSKWGCAGFSIQGAKARGVGSGASNTQAILVGCPIADTGARIADNLVIGGKDDWFLPSIDELSLLYQSRGFFTDLSKRIYMSSTEADASNAILAGFNDGVMGGGGSKNGSWSVRPIRYVVASSVDTTVRTPPARATCAQGGLCNIGDVGPGGGIVFYARLDGGTFAAKYSRCNTQCRYLEFATPTPGLKRPWAVSQYSQILVPNGTKLEIGAGLENSVNILNQGNYVESAAAYARNLKQGGQADWYLPSSEELRLIFGVSTVSHLEPCLGESFWTSTEGTGFTTFPNPFNNATASFVQVGRCGEAGPICAYALGGRAKTELMNIIPVRAF